MREKEEYMVLRLNGQVRSFLKAGTYEVAKSNGVIFGNETHWIEVPYVAGEIRRKIE